MKEVHWKNLLRNNNINVNESNFRKKTYSDRFWIRIWSSAGVQSTSPWSAIDVETLENLKKNQQIEREKKIETKPRFINKKEYL